MIEKLTPGQIAEFERLVEECAQLATQEERNRRISEVGDSMLRELLREALDEPVSARDIPPRTRLNDYELVTRLGGGGFGEVWRARCVDGQPGDVAIKVVRTEHLQHDDTGRFVVLFQEEIARHAALNHDGIIKLLAAGSVALPGFARTTPYLVMELWDGLPLHHACRGRTTEEKIQCMIQVCEAVQYAHRHGLMHLDLKPENILVVEEAGRMRVKILDFGLARAFRADQPFDPGSFGAGTLPYKAPEQIDRSLGGEDFRTDVHALGVVLFQILTDRLPYPLQQGTDAEYQRFILEGPRLKLGELDRELDPRLQEITNRAMAIDRSQRFDSPARLAAVLQRWLRSRRPARGWYAVAGLAVVVILVMLAMFATRKPGPPGRWERVSIPVNGYDKSAEFVWHDMVWNGREGWLCGSIGERGGPEEFIGRGVLLHTVDGGKNWQGFGETNFDAGAGTLSCFLETKWNGIGPMLSITIEETLQPDGRYLTNGWIASVDGIYFTTNAGSPGGQWRRLTPRPDGPDCYSFFNGFTRRNADRDLYAYGWQGIAHQERGHEWEVQLKTHQYPISKMFFEGGDFQNAWAVADAAEEARVNASKQNPRVYHLSPPGTNWEAVPLTGIKLPPRNGLFDICQLPHSQTLLAVGDDGLIIRGGLENGQRVWKISPVQARRRLLAIAFDDNGDLWAVGAHGLVLYSRDKGVTWMEIPCRNPDDSTVTEDLARIVFPGNNQGWIVGNNTVLRYELPR